MPTKQEIEAELRMSEHEKTRALIQETISDIDEFEAMLTRLEDRVRQPHWSSLDPLVERLARVGMSKEAIKRITHLFELLSCDENGRPLLPEELRKLSADIEAAERSAWYQLSNIVARQNRRSS